MDRTGAADQQKGDSLHHCPPASGGKVQHIKSRNYDYDNVTLFAQLKKHFPIHPKRYTV